MFFSSLFGQEEIIFVNIFWASNFVIFSVTLLYLQDFGFRPCVKTREFVYMPCYQLQAIVGYMAVLFKHLIGWPGAVCPNVLHLLDQKVKLKNALRHSVRMSLGFSPAEPRNWKWSNSVGNISIIWCISITYNVKTCKKISERAQTAKFSVLSRLR